MAGPACLVWALGLRADPLPDPVITAFATPSSAQYAATNLSAPYFNDPALEYATLRQGAVSTPLTRNVNDGTLALTRGALSIGARLNADDTAPESGWWHGADFPGPDRSQRPRPAGRVDLDNAVGRGNCAAGGRQSARRPRPGPSTPRRFHRLVLLP
jgi:hypothetical protein